MSELRIGVIGIGARSKLALHSQQFGGKITAAVDPSPQGQKRLNQKLGADIPLYQTTTEAIKAGIDAAFVTSPDDTHAANHL
ncbi:Gfo/Idh/MocA family oxidoreductase [Gleimia sp. 6138-11-ORH1]|uniref:Gfo/Idh/MocA family oxidoreductase n=1 Tax=Gleimia sp. 6138-11-ORH1 TaxID=2973937 RepID=UPI00286EA23C|nr:Gfo/Idh/MocA family oxidoreductase [Gleimia sp. 6138-11-ORH1]